MQKTVKIFYVKKAFFCDARTDTDLNTPNIFDEFLCLNCLFFRAVPLLFNGQFFLFLKLLLSRGDRFRISVVA